MWEIFLGQKSGLSWAWFLEEVYHLVEAGEAANMSGIKSNNKPIQFSLNHGFRSQVDAQGVGFDGAGRDGQGLGNLFVG